MVKISVREFTHHISDYMERVHKGERFVIIKYNKPIADIVPHQRKAAKQNWSMEKPKLKIKGLSLSKELVKFREEERS